MSKIFIMGSGSFGTALAILYSKDHDVILWGRAKEKLEVLKKSRENTRYLPGVTIPEKVLISDDINLSKNCSFIIVAVPSVVVKESVTKLKGIIKDDAIIVLVSKGLNQVTYEPLYKDIEEVLPKNKVVVLSGPSHAEEVSRGCLTSVVAASSDSSAAKKVQELSQNTNLRVYTSTDPLGVSLAGAFKNIIALAAGICDGLKTGDNTKAALMTRGLAEVDRLAVCLGAKFETVHGLAGTGDLIVTCCSSHSRNHRCGEYLGQGLSVKESIKKVDMVVEGIYATTCAYNLAKKAKVDMPITNEIYKIITEEEDAKSALYNLFSRPQKCE